MLNANRFVPAVEVTHVAGIHVDRADGEPHGPAVDVIEVDRFCRNKPPLVSWGESDDEMAT